MNTLKLIACWKQEKPKGTRGFDDIPPEEREYAGLWYLHGALESLVGYDKAIVTNLKEGNFGKPHSEFGYSMCIDDIVHVEIEGVPEPCIGYFWTTKTGENSWVQRGLVCLVSDVEGRKYAESKYNEKSRIL